MKKNSSNPFPEPTRQNAGAIFIRIIDFVKGLIVQFFPILIVFLLAGKGRIELVFIVFALATGFISIFLSILHYFRFHFHIEKDALVITRGLLNRTHTSVPFDRIQVVNFEASVIHRMLNVVKIVVETAGSKSSESEIYALKKDDAIALRDYLLLMRDDHLVDKKEPRDMADSEIDLSNTDREPLFSLTLRDLLKIGLTNNHLKSASLMIAVGFGYLSQYWVYLEDVEDLPYLGMLSGLFDSVVPSVIILGVISLLLLAVMLSVANSIIRYYGLNVMEVKGGLKVSSGLLNRREFSARNRKLQIFYWNTNPLRRLVGLYSATMAQASSDDSIGSQSIVVPGCNTIHLDSLRNKFFAGVNLEVNVLYKPDKRMIGRYFIFFGLIPLTIIFALIYFIFGILFGWVYLFLLPLLLILIVYRNKFELRVNEEVIFIKKGIIEDTWKLIHLYKVQSISLHQTPYMQHRDLVNLHIHTAAGSLSVPYISLRAAEKLRDFLMYKVETSKKSWI
nr:PH domain-containing protein [Saprospiraceae bacterium]